MTDPNRVVARNIRLARLLRDLTQEEVAQRLAPIRGRLVGKATISAAERSADAAPARVRKFTVSDLFAYSEALDVPVSWLLSESNGRVEEEIVQHRQEEEAPLAN